MSIDRIEQHLADWTSTHGHALLRCGLALVFVWFGAPKLVPGLSPAEALVAATVTWFDPDWFVPTLGVAEILIGVCLARRAWARLGLVLMAGHMFGTALPLVTLPEVCWKAFPIATLEGQYILKNVVLVSAAIVIAGSVRSRRARAPRIAWTARSRYRLRNG